MRLIDADEFLNTVETATAIASLCTNDGLKRAIIKSTYPLISGLVVDIPTVDAVPVRCGKWLDVCCAVKCNCCDETYSDEIFLMRGKINYCPNCGAKLENNIFL